MRDNNIFNKVFIPGIQSSTFDLSHDVKTTGSQGELLPVNILDVMPGDRFTITPSNMLRYMPLVTPVMHRVHVETRYFFIPNRLSWTEWDEWISGNTDVEHPFEVFGVITTGSLMDYLGYPVGDFTGLPDGGLKVSVFPIVAYLRVWNEFFRDQNLQDEFIVDVLPGDNGDAFDQWATDSPPHVNWRHDYFTASLPFAQKGDAVQIPLSVQNDVPVEFRTNPGGPTQNAPIWRDWDGTPAGSENAVINRSGPVPISSSSQTTASEGAIYDPRGTLVVDVQTDAATLNDLRTAWTLQSFLERTARVGSRIWEVLKGQFGVNSPDGRVKRPYFIGGSRQSMVISEVLATAENTEAVVPVGTMAGHGISVGGGNTIRYTSTEHGFILGLLFVRPETAYSQGVPKPYTLFGRYDYPWPVLAALGEQPVLNKEVYALHSEPEGTFGYMPNLEWCRFKNSMFTAEMRNTLSNWHLGRIFTTEPVLNSEFVECNPDTRIFAVTDEDEDHLVIHVHNSVIVNRRLPRNGIPATIS